MATAGYPSDLSDEERTLIAPHLPAAKSGGRPRTTDLRHVVDAIFYVPRSGCQWRLLIGAASALRLRTAAELIAKSKIQLPPLIAKR